MWSPRTGHWGLDSGSGLARLEQGGILEIPCLESSDSTQSIEGGLRPKGIGSHGLSIASFTALSITSSACTYATHKF